MSRAVSVFLFLTAAQFPLSAGAASAGETPIPVSPGAPSGTAMVEGPCPTFSWGDVDGAESYELAIYRLEEEGDEMEIVLQHTLTGAASSWTPSLDRCLERGARYAWSIRAVGQRGGLDWAPPNLFEVAAGANQEELEAALAVVRQYLGDELGEGAGVSPEGTKPMLGGNPESVTSIPRGEAVPGGSLQSTAVGDPALQVNGSSVVTTATQGPGVARQLCLAVDYRYVDLGDGTVLDCNTQKQWLKDAGCLADGDWDADETPGSVQGKVLDLNDTNMGSDFNCTDYTDGTYTDWRVPEMEEMCGSWISGCTGDCCTSEDGLIDSTFFGPAVLNAAGDGQWVTEDAFVVLNILYWSATTRNPLEAYNLNVASGDVSFTDKSTAFFVWPVRDAQ